MDKVISIVKYTDAERDRWNEFVDKSRNGTFLFDRGYMDYHSDRFRDCSWMAYKGDSLAAILPANIDSEGVIHSHQGLTYGGWILPPAHIDGADLLDIFQMAVRVWRGEGIRALDYKPVPFIYTGQPSEEDIYALFRLGASVSEVNLSSAINLQTLPGYNKLRRRILKKSKETPFQIEETSDAEIFMALVNNCLLRRHNAQAVHSASEIEILKQRFPDNIRMFILKREACSLPDAGVMVYDTGRVAHTQYIASTEEGRNKNLLTPLFDYLISTEFRHRAYFDFGTSNEEHGQYLNEGLLRQKFSFGATGVAYRRFFLDLTSGDCQI
ncbi:MAG: GNAT family N-acetyltransferase [Muribaculaceae bacterium]|nr:GNAT family N-acetyltransferase [Muribaculaceae bacterium]